MKTKKVISIVNLILLISVIVINILANSLPVNVFKTGESSNGFPKAFIPASITFSIWTLIYALLMFLVIYNIYISFKQDSRDLNKFNIVLSCNLILNIAWTLMWRSQLFFPSWLIMIGSLGTLAYLSKFLNKKIIHTLLDKIVFRGTISIYFGWVTVATIANSTVFLIYKQWATLKLPENSLIISITILGTIIAIINLIFNKDILYSLVFVWAYAGIMIKRLPINVMGIPIVHTTIFAIVTILIFSLITYIKIRPKRVIL